MCIFNFVNVQVPVPFADQVMTNYLLLSNPTNETKGHVLWYYRIASCEFLHVYQPFGIGSMYLMKPIMRTKNS